MRLSVFIILFREMNWPFVLVLKLTFMALDQVTQFEYGFYFRSFVLLKGNRIQITCFRA